MYRFGKTMAAIYGAGWEDRVDKGKMRQQYMANKKMFDSIAEKAIADANSGARRLLGNIPSVPNREVNIPTGKPSDLAIGFGATERIMDEQLRNANAIEDPEIKVSEIKTYTGNNPKRFVQTQEVYSPADNQYSRNDEILQSKTNFYQQNIANPVEEKYIKAPTKDELAKRKVKEQRERLSKDMAIITYPINFWNYYNAAKDVYGVINDTANGIYNFFANGGAKDLFLGKPNHSDNTPKYTEPNGMKITYQRFQQGGQVQDAQQKFISYIAEIFGIQNEAQLKQVVNKLGKQGIAQLQKAFQQGVPAEQIRQQMQGRTQSAKQGAKITRTGDFVPCAKCGGKAKKKRFADGGAIQSAGCGCSGVRKGCGGMTFSAKCGGKAKRVSKKENGGTVPETYGRPVGGATVLPFLMKNSNKKPKRFNAR